MTYVPLTRVTEEGVRGEFYTRYEAQPGLQIVQSIALINDSNQVVEPYEMLATAPVLQRRAESNLAQTLTATEWVVRNHEYATGVTVDRRISENDKTGQISARITDLAARTADHWISLSSDLLNAAETGLAYDAAAYVSDARGAGKNNLLAYAIDVDGTSIPTDERGTAADPSPRLMQNVILRGMQNLYGLTDDQGEPLNANLRDFVVMVPTNYWVAAAHLSSGAALSTGVPNLVTQMAGYNVTIMPNPRLTDTNGVFVFAAGTSAQALILQEERGIEVDVLGPGTEYYAQNKKSLITVNAIRGAAYGHPHHVTKINVSDS